MVVIGLNLSVSILNININLIVLESKTLCFLFIQVPLAIGGPGLAPSVRFHKDVPNGGLANVAATVMNLHGFEAPNGYEPTLIEVVDNQDSIKNDIKMSS